MDSVKLREILVEVAQGGAKELADPEAFECAVNSGHEDIMSALKRVPGVVSDMETAPKSGEFMARRMMNGRWFQGFLQGMGNPNAVVDGMAGRWYDCDAWAPLPDDLAKRITSAVEPDPLQRHWDALRDRNVAATSARIDAKRAAVEPSCVVTDEMVEAAWPAFVCASEDWRDGAVRRRDDLDKAALKAALTAALSSRTEEEPKWKPITEAPYRVKVIARRSSDGVLVDGWVNENGSVTDHIYNTSHECDLFTFAWPIKPPARSLTNGGE